MEAGIELKDYFEEGLEVGSPYSIPSPDVEGYTPDLAIVTGVIEKGVNYHTVTYSRNDKYYTITIRHVYAREDLTEIGEPFKIEEHEIKVGASYDFKFKKEGYRVEPESYSGTMGDLGVNYVVTIKYVEDPDWDKHYIRAIVDLDAVKIPEGLTVQQAIARLPEKVTVYVDGTVITMEIEVKWNESLEDPYPNPSELIFDKYYTTGRYEFVGELKLPYNVLNPWGYKPEIDVDIYPVVEDPYNPVLDYSELNREIEGTADDYSVWYEDGSGDKQGLWEKYVDGYIYERYNYEDNYYKGLHEKYYGENYGLTVRAYYDYGYDEIDELWRDFLHGEYKSWYANGSPEKEGWFTKDLQTGEWTNYYSNGVKESEGSYNENGRKDGEWVYNFDNGNLESKGSYDDGKRTGKWYSYDEHGNESIIEY